MALFNTSAHRGASILSSFIGLYSRSDANSLYDVLGRVRWTRISNTPRPPPWYIKQKTAYIKQNLTKKNETFLKEITEDIYSEKMKSVATIAPESNPLRVEGAERKPWTPDSIRTGLVAKKIGVVPQWTKEGKLKTCTLLQVQGNYVARYTDPETWYKTSTVGKRYGRRVLGRLSIAVNPSDPQQFTAQYRGMFEESGVMPPARLATFAITPDAKIEPGTRVGATHFKVGQWLTLWGNTINRGFQGVMKRWGFKGGPGKGRGTTKWHRRPGSIGTKGDATVRRGKCMPGVMGGRWRPAYGAKLVRINTKYQVLYVMGNMVMGKTGNYVYVRDCGIWYKRVKDPSFPTHYREEDKEALPEDIYDPAFFNFSDPTITFPEAEEKKVRAGAGSKVKKQAKVKK